MSGTQVIIDDEIICPNCGDMIYNGDLHLGDGDSVKIDCDDCGAPLSIECSMTTTFRTTTSRE